MAMFHLFLEAGFPFEVAHCNFGLRGKESDADQAFVEGACAQKGVKCHSVEFESEMAASKAGDSVQQRARRLRYDYFEKVRKKQGLDHIATAHHADDNLENFFIYLLRNNLGAAFRGIPVDNPPLIRPMMAFGRDEIREHLSSQSLTWREDRSNAEDKYLRNKLRHMILPGLQHEYPEASRDYLKLSEAYRQNELQLNHTAFAKMLGTDNWEFPFDALKHPAIAIIFRNWLSGFGLHADRVTQIASNRNTGKSFPLKPGFELYITRKGFTYRKTATPKAIKIPLSNLPWEGHYGKFHIQMEFTTMQPENLKEDGVYYFDAEILGPELTLRPWKQHDRMQVFGSGGQKKLSDIFIDKRIELPYKKDFPVLESDGHIIAVMGLKRSNNAPVQVEKNIYIKVEYENTR